MTMYFDSRVMAHVHVNWLAPVKVRRTLIGGSRKMVVYDDLEPSEKIKVYDKGITVNGDHAGNGNGNGNARYQMMVGYRTGDVWSPQLDITTEALSLELRHFDGCIQDNTTPLVDGHAGLRVVRLLEAATESMRNSGRPVDLAANRCTV